jgi:hypothetical protein
VIFDEWLEADPEESSAPEPPKPMPPLPATSTLTVSEFPPGAVVTLSTSTAPPPNTTTLTASEFPPAAIVTLSTSDPPPAVVMPAPVAIAAAPPPLPAAPIEPTARNAFAQPIPTVTEATIDVPLPPAPLVPKGMSVVEERPPRRRRTSRTPLVLAFGALFAGGFGFAAFLWNRAPSSDTSAMTKNIAPRDEPRASASAIVASAAASTEPPAPAASLEKPMAAASAAAPAPIPSSQAVPAVASVQAPAAPETVAAPAPVEKKTSAPTEAPAGEAVAPPKPGAPAAPKTAERAPETDLSGLEPAKPTKVASNVDDEALQQALAEAAARAKGCRDTTSPTGVATVSVTIAASGDATGAVVTGPPFAHTLEGDCIAAKFRSVHVPAFRGDTINVRKSVTLQ